MPTVHVVGKEEEEEQEEEGREAHLAEVVMAVVMRWFDWWLQRWSWRKRR